MKANAEAFSQTGFNYLGVSYRELDCQAFVEECMKDVGLSHDLPGSNAWYRAMTWTGTPEECKKKYGCIPQGALLFILKQDGNEPTKYMTDGIGNASHMGIKTGTGKGAIHSSASKGCVAESVFNDKTINGGWNRVGLWDRFDYGERIDAALVGQELPAEEAKVVIRVKNAIVKTDSGKGVNFRAKKSTDGGYLGNIPDGTRLEITEDDGTWSAIYYKGRKGYVMSQFLMSEESDTVELTLDKTAAVLLHTALEVALYGGGDSID